MCIHFGNQERRRLERPKSKLSRRIDNPTGDLICFRSASCQLLTFASFPVSCPISQLVLRSLSLVQRAKPLVCSALARLLFLLTRPLFSPKLLDLSRFVIYVQLQQQQQQHHSNCFINSPDAIQIGSAEPRTLEPSSQSAHLQREAKVMLLLVTLLQKPQIHSISSCEFVARQHQQQQQQQAAEAPVCETAKRRRNLNFIPPFSIILISLNGRRNSNIFINFLSNIQHFSTLIN